MLFIFESRETGEFEPGPDGESLPVTELDLYQYANMNVLKEHLSWIEYDNVRFALGLEAIRTAAVKGQQITSNIRDALNSDGKGDALDNKEGNNNTQTVKLTGEGFKPQAEEPSQNSSSTETIDDGFTRK